MTSKEFWSSAGKGVVAAGRAVGKGSLFIGRQVASAYNAIDPDVRRHVAELPLLGLTLLAPSAKTVTALPDDGHRPVLFVHGLGGKASSFVGLRTYLRWHGRERTYALGFDSPATMDQLVERLRAFVAEIVAVNQLAGGARVDLVAHSMGGLVARLALEDPATAERVANLVTLGTPHAGTHTARFGATPHLLSLRPDSEMVRKLNAQLPWSGKTRLVAFWSKADMMVLPATAACVEGAYNEELPGFTHYTYLIHPRGWERVRWALEG